MEAKFPARGHASLEVEQVFNESTVTCCFATSPLKLLTPRSRGRCVCTYVSSFGGGLVAGDQTRLELRVGRNARCFLSTQSSTKVYRNPQLLPCGHVTNATVEEKALLVFAPAPVQPFAESSYDQRQEFRLGPGAGLVLLDWFTSGRAACGERWSFAHFSSRNEVWYRAVSSKGEESAALEPVFVDACKFNGSEGSFDTPHRTGRFNCFATLALIGAPLKNAAERLLEEISRLAVERRSALILAASPIRNGAVLRLAGEQMTTVDQCLRHHLIPVAETLGEDPWSRRW